MLPSPRLRMPGATARARRKMPFRSMSKVRSHLSSVSAASGVRWAMPALATTTSMRLCRFSRSATSASVADVERTS
ncbi:hypothetical protein D3C72_2227950 [compost metagenome]